MQAHSYQRRNPSALAITAGCTELIVALLAGFSMMGMTGGYNVGGFKVSIALTNAHGY